MNKLDRKLVIIAVIIGVYFIFRVFSKQTIFGYITNQQNQTIEKALQICSKFRPAKGADTFSQSIAMTNYNHCMSDNYIDKIIKQNRNYLSILMPATIIFIVLFFTALVVFIIYIYRQRKMVKKKTK
jgi:hypothetical protein